MIACHAMAMSGELDLSRLLATLEPKLQDGDYVFATLADKAAAAACAVDAIGTFAEAEGITLIVPAGYSCWNGVLRRAALDHADVPFIARSRRPHVPRFASLGIARHLMQRGRRLLPRPHLCGARQS